MIYNTISQKWCNVETQLQWTTSRKSYVDCGIATLLIILNDLVLRNRMHQRKRDSFAIAGFLSLTTLADRTGLRQSQCSLPSSQLSPNYTRRWCSAAENAQRAGKKRKWKRRVSTPNASLIMVVDATTSLSFSTSATTRRGHGARRLQQYSIGAMVLASLLLAHDMSSRANNSIAMLEQQR